jgi:hypothetical protein
MSGKTRAALSPARSAFVSICYHVHFCPHSAPARALPPTRPRPNNRWRTIAAAAGRTAVGCSWTNVGECAFCTRFGLQAAILFSARAGPDRRN